MPAFNRSHYGGDYDRRAAANLRRWNADPTTVCWQCGRTKHEHRREWTNGHERDGDPTARLLPECAECNFRRGAIAGNARRTKLTTSRDW